MEIASGSWGPFGFEKPKCRFLTRVMMCLGWGADADDPRSYGLTSTATSEDAFGQVTLTPIYKTNPAPSHKSDGTALPANCFQSSPFPCILKLGGASSSSELHKCVDTEPLVRMISHYWTIASALKGTQSLKSPRQEAEPSTSFLPAGNHILVKPKSKFSNV